MVVPLIILAVTYGPAAIAVAGKGLDMYKESQDRKKDANSTVTEGEANTSVDQSIDKSTKDSKDSKKDFAFAVMTKGVERAVIEKGIEVSVGLVQKGVQTGVVQKGAKGVFAKVKREKNKDGDQGNESGEAVLGVVVDANSSTENQSLEEKKAVENDDSIVQRGAKSVFARIKREKRKDEKKGDGKAKEELVLVGEKNSSTECLSLEKGKPVEEDEKRDKKSL